MRAVCVHVYVCEAFIVISLETGVGPGPQLICSDVGLRDRHRWVCVCDRDRQTREGRKVK